MAKTIEQSLSAAIGEALLKDKTIAFIVARELAKTPEFLEMALQRIDPQLIGREIANQVLEISDKGRATHVRNAMRNSKESTSILAEARLVATRITAQRIADDVAQA